MSLRAGYYGLKKKLLEKVIGIPAIKSIGSGLALNLSTGELSATGVDVSIIGNPEGEATAGDLAKLQIGDDIFNVPDTTYSNATTTTAGLMSASDKTKLNGLDKDAYFLRSEQVVLGAKNVLENTAVSDLQNGVIYVVNADKSVTLESGTATSGVFIRIGQINYKGSWKLSGVTGGSSETYGLTIRTEDLQSPSFGAIDNYDGDTSFTIPNDYNNPLYVYVRVPTGATVSNVVIKPMISFDGGEFVPYAMTNKELTVKVQGIINAATNATDFAAFKTAIGNL